MEQFKYLLSGIDPTRRSGIAIPAELENAWLHILMSLVMFIEDPALSESKATICSNMVRDGMAQVIKGLVQTSLSERSVLMPLDVTSLINLRLLHDLTSDRPDITESYRASLSSIVCLGLSTTLAYDLTFFLRRTMSQQIPWRGPTRPG